MLYYIGNRLETYSVVVCEEWSGLQDLPYSQFGIVFQWEADGDPSPCVSHCVRQSIQVVALSTILPRPTGESLAVSHLFLLLSPVVYCFFHILRNIISAADSIIHVE